MKELVLNELKVYAKEVNSKSIQGVRSHYKKLGLLNKIMIRVYVETITIKESYHSLKKVKKSFTSNF